MYDVIIIGGGVVGSAAAYYLSQYDLKLLMLEAFNDVADGTTKANSAVIHAGYDPKPGSLMAKYNVEGSKLTKELVKKLDVPYVNDGSLVLAFSPEDLKTLKELYDRGVANGVEQLKLLNYEETRDIEPGISDNVYGSLYAGTSAVISPWEYCLALAETAVRNGMDLKLSNEVTGIRKNEDGTFTVTTVKGEYQGRYVINAAGIYADKVHEMIGKKEFTITPVRGQYFLLDKSQYPKAKHTLFQCPSERGKGVAVTPTVHGNLIVGPDATRVDGEDLDTTADILSYVRETASLSIKDIDYRENIRNFSGLRARSDRGDFIIEESHSVPNFFNLAGMASPALSSAAAIGVVAKDWVLSKQAYPKKEHYVDSRRKIRFKQLSDEEKNRIIKEDPAYGRIICRCETVTEGEIRATFKTPIPPRSIDAVKRRTNAGMGRCQGGFCGERVAMILKEELGLEYDEILQDREGTVVLEKQAKEDYGNV
ncbi:MAG: NAD(P)/FAD-dependent oxidoreductase [Erysipelotrichaceae bacterium]|nr:NAD(P)/FAD-dependent oxidoreductase [Erysipelotrichaceae bacterium]